MDINKIKFAMIFSITTTIIVKTLGFFRSILITNFLGINETTDAFFAVLTIVSILLSIVTISLNSTFIPVYQGIRDLEEKKDFLSSLFIWMSILMILILTVALTNIERIISILYSGFSVDQSEIVKKSFIILSPALIICAYNGIFSGKLQTEKKYKSISMSTLLLNTVVVLSLLFYRTEITIEKLSVSFLIGYILQFIALNIINKSKIGGFSSWFNPKFHSGIREMTILTLPVLISGSLNYLNTIIDQYLASRHHAGSITQLTLAYSLILFIIGIIGILLQSIYFNETTEKINKHGIISVKNNFIFALDALLCSLVPISLFICFYAEEIVYVFFYRGAIKISDVEIISKILVVFGLGLVVFSFQILLTRTFYSMKDMKTPTKIAVFAIAINIISSYILSQYIGIIGIALGTVISSIFNTYNLYRKINRYFKYKITKSRIVSLFKIFMIPLVLCLFLNYLYLDNLKLYNIKFIDLFAISAIYYLVTIALYYFAGVEIVQSEIKKLNVTRRTFDGIKKKIKKN